MHMMTQKLLSGESLWVFEQQAQDSVSKTMINYKLVVEVTTTHFFPPKAL